MARRNTRDRLDHRLVRLERRYRWRYSILPVTAMSLAVVVVLVGVVGTLVWVT